MAADFSGFPRVDALASRPELASLADVLGQAALTDLAREVLAELRADLVAGARPTSPSLDEAAAALLGRGNAILATRAVEVLNATGVLLHTNLGRAPLSDEATSRLAARARGYSSIELDLVTGKRGRRGAFVEDALVRLTGAEDALAVNNCAGAALLMLSALARGRTVVVSRGELVEIGGGFRVPEILEESGAKLVEVGTTNKTRAADVDRALAAAGPGSAVLSVHPGNFLQTGFVERPTLVELSEVARRREALLLFDLGGGALVDLARAGFVGEPIVQDVIRAGVDVVTFSADKALGGPQGGLAVGRRPLVEAMRRHPLHRALRMGRLPMSALEATLESYLRGQAWVEVPALAAALVPVDALRARAARWAAALGAEARVVDLTAEMGGGTLAGRSVPSAGIALATPADAEGLLRALRFGVPPIVARVHQGSVALDARTIPDRDDERLLHAVSAALARVKSLSVIDERR